MHVRLAPFAGRRHLIGAGRARRFRSLPLLLVALTASSLAAGCHRPAPPSDATIEWTLAPTPPRVGPARLTLRCLGGDRRPVRAAVLRVDGHMSHPGMAPILATATERAPGVYEADLQFTMRGDWILIVSGSLPGGGTVHQRIDLPGVGPAE